MVGAINRANFGGVQKVSCWTCHHGRDVPASSIMLDRLYEAPNDELDDLVVQDKDSPSAESILDKYIAALGGAQRLNGLTSYIATGASVGFGEFGGTADFTIFAKAPDKRTTLINYKEHPDRGESLWTINGNTGFIKTPRALLRDYQVVGEELNAAKFEARLSFPGGIKTALTNWRSGLKRAIGSKDYFVLQGNGQNGFMATLYIDPDTDFLARMVRYGASPVGHVLTQTDYADYRDVNGIKFPFDYKFSWLDGRFQAKLKEIRVNVPIDDARFGKP